MAHTALHSGCGPPKLCARHTALAGRAHLTRRLRIACDAAERNHASGAWQLNAATCVVESRVCAVRNRRQPSTRVHAMDNGSERGSDGKNNSSTSSSVDSEKAAPSASLVITASGGHLRLAPADASMDNAWHGHLFVQWSYAQSHGALSRGCVLSTPAFAASEHWPKLAISEPKQTHFYNLLCLHALLLCILRILVPLLTLTCRIAAANNAAAGLAVLATAALTVWREPLEDLVYGDGLGTAAGWGAGGCRWNKNNLVATWSVVIRFRSP